MSEDNTQHTQSILLSMLGSLPDGEVERQLTLRANVGIFYLKLCLAHGYLGEVSGVCFFNSRRSFIRALWSCDLDVPTATPSILAISSCS